MDPIGLKKGKALRLTKREVECLHNVGVGKDFVECIRSIKCEIKKIF